jgi:hypothetical protein
MNTKQLINARDKNLNVGDIVYYNLFGENLTCRVIKVLCVSDTMNEYVIENVSNGAKLGTFCNFELRILGSKKRVK